MTSTLCIHLATHFVRMPSCFIIFMLPFSAVALAHQRSTFISAMSDHRSVLGSCRSVVLCLQLPSLPPITYSTSPSTATQWPYLERKITYFVMFYVSLLLMFICCWHRSIFLHKRQLYLRHCWIAIHISCQTNLKKLYTESSDRNLLCLKKDQQRCKWAFHAFHSYRLCEWHRLWSVCQSWTYV
jgi:hypothetical protein